MSEYTGQLVGPNVEQRYLKLAVDGRLHCPVCDHSTALTKAGRVSLRVFDRFRGHLLGHDIIDFVEAAQALTSLADSKG